MQPGQSGESSSQRMNGECPSSPQSADSNSNAPSSSHIQPNSLRMDQETSITPSISLIPIKQEPCEDSYEGKRNGSSNLSSSPSGNVQMQTATSSSLSSLIKVSPLKSLLREDLKRKISSRNASARGRATASPNSNLDTSHNDNATTTNGTITSTGSEQPSDSSGWRIGKRSSLQCAFCGIGFPDQTLYFLHKGCHSDANPWKCNICGEQCCNVYEFNSHLLSKSHQ